MAGLTEPLQTAGKREDLADIYSIVDMRSTPFTSRVNKSAKPTNTRFDWVVDAYAAHRNEGVVDGTDVADYENHAENRAELSNYIQIFRRTAKVSRLSENVSTIAGVRSEIALATKKKLVELKRDQEATFLDGNNGRADNGSVGYLTIGLDKWIDTTGPTVPTSVPAAYRPAAAQVITTATTSLNEDTDIQGILKAIFDNTGMQDTYLLLAGSVLRRAFTDMTRTTTQTTNAANIHTNLRARNFNGTLSEKTITNTTTVFVGDFGALEVVPSSFIGGATVDTDRGYVLDMDKIHLRSNKQPSVESFPDLGGGPRILVEAIAGIQVDNPKGLGKFKPA